MTGHRRHPRHDRPVHPRARRARAGPRARPLHHGPAGPRPRPRVRRRVPARAPDRWAGAGCRATTRPRTAAPATRRSLRPATTRRPTRRCSRRPEDPLGTEYTLNWLPIGGFVKLEDENGGDSFDPRSFGNAPGWPIKLGILVAGVVMNLLLAFAIFTGIAWFATPDRRAHSSTAVEPGSPAADGGPRGRRRDPQRRRQRLRLLRRRTTAIRRSSDLRAHAGQAVTLGILRADGVASRTSRPRSAREAELDAGKGALGIKAGDQGFESRSSASTPAVRWPRPCSIGWSETMRWFGLILDGPRRPRGLDRHQPDGGAARVGPRRHRDLAGRDLPEQRADHACSTSRACSRRTSRSSTSCRSRRSTAAGC